MFLQQRLDMCHDYSCPDPSLDLGRLLIYFGLPRTVSLCRPRTLLCTIDEDSRPFENAFQRLRQEKHTTHGNTYMLKRHQRKDTASGSGQQRVYYTYFAHCLLYRFRHRVLFLSYFSLWLGCFVIIDGARTQFTSN